MGNNDAEMIKREDTTTAMDEDGGENTPHDPEGSCPTVKKEEMTTGETGDDAAATTTSTTVNEDNKSQQQQQRVRIVLPPPPVAAQLLSQSSADNNSRGNDKRLYWDRSHYASPADQIKALSKSSTLYVGNLSFSTRSCHVRSHFAQLGPVRSVFIGLDRLKKTPCGFCFVEYFDRNSALRAVSVLSGTKLDGRVIRVELDAGFQPGRQYGRGMSGGQVRDDRRQSNDRRGSFNSRKRSRPPPPPPPPPRPRPPPGPPPGPAPVVAGTGEESNRDNIAGDKSVQPSNGIGEDGAAAGDYYGSDARGAEDMEPDSKRRRMG